MAKTTRKIMAWILVLTLITGQLALPAAAEEAAEPPAVEVIVDVAPVPEAPAAESQAPAASETTTVTTSAPVTTSTSDSAANVTQESTSTTTSWSGSEGGSSTSGSETTTTVTGTDNTTGQTLYEGGTTSGSETTVTTETTSGSETTEGFVTQEVTTSTESTATESSSATIEGEETSTTISGTWTDTENGYTEGQFQQTGKETKEETSETITLGDEALPEDGITIDMTLDTKASDPDEGTYTYTGTAGTEIIPLEDVVDIPEGATLVKDAKGNVIGYTLNTTTETITGTEVKEGQAQADAENSSTDTTGTTAAVTPDLNTSGVRIDNNSSITEETDGNGKVTAYVVTNTSEESYEIDSIEALTRPEAGAALQEDGSTITTAVEDILDDAGNVIGMKITNVHFDVNGKELSRSETTQTVENTPIPEAAEPVITYTLPEKPAESTKTEDGITTTVTVTDILDEKGNVIGYKSTTVRTDESGAELYREENDLYGTEETVTESITTENPNTKGTATVKVTTVETTRVTAEETTFTDIAAYTRLNQIVNDMTVDKTSEVVMIDGKLYYIYTGSVTVSEGKNHGNTSLMEPLGMKDGLFVSNSALDLGNGGGTHSDGTPEEGYKYVGYGINTSLDISYNDVIQFRLKDANGKEFYALCIDFNTGIRAGHLYDLNDLSSEDYYQKDGSVTVESAEKIRIIALNGYWGTEDNSQTTSDIGSLDEVKNLLTSYLTAQGKLSEEEIQQIVGSLTPGQALAATQAALWKYGNIDGKSTVNENNLVSNGYEQNKKGHWVKNEDYTNTEYLYEALLDLANDPDTQLEADEGVEFLDAEDITATSIVVKEKIASADDEGNTTKKNIYNTDLNFTLGIEPTKLFGDLKVTVYDSNGNEVKTVVLASEEGTIIGLKPDANGMYTISDVEIAEGVNVNLKLHGTQNVGTGVYIYTSLDGKISNSQTLVTLATGYRSVDLDISMKLDVQEPTATKTTSGETQYGTRTDTQKQTKTDEIQRKSTITKTQWERKETTETESSLVYTSDVTLTQVSTKETKEEKSWKFSWLKRFDPEPAPENDDGPTGGDPEDNTPKNNSYEKEPTRAKKLNNKKGSKIIIEDEKVPLAKAPKTGDLSGIWAVISGLSLGGAALLNRKRKEEE